MRIHPAFRFSMALLFVMSFANAVQHADDNLIIFPEIISFRAMDQVETILLSTDSGPVPSSDILATRLLIDKKDYSHMIRAKKEDGKLLVSPSDTLEVGSYDLEIRTRHGVQIVEVYAPLTDLPYTLEKHAATAGIPVEELLDDFGLTTHLPERIDKLVLPSRYFEGQVLDARIDTQDGFEYTWAVNDDVVAQGPDAKRLQYVFTQPGEYTVTLAQSRTGKVIALTTARTQVDPLEPIPVYVTAGTDVMLSAPEGFESFAWSVQGQRIDTERTFRRRFDEPGEYKVVCLARQPKTGHPGHFMRVTYVLTVAMP